MAVSEFFKNMMERRDKRLPILSTVFTSAEVTTEAASDALVTAQLTGSLSQTEIKRREDLIQKSGAMASANSKIGKQLGEKG